MAHEELQSLTETWLKQRHFIKLFKKSNGQFSPIDINQFSLGNKYEDVLSEEHLAVLVDNDYIVIDVDDKQRTGIGEAILKVVTDYGWLCHICQTDTGYHLWFKKPQTEINNFVNKIVPLGVKIDVKNSGKKSMVTVKKNGKWRKWIQIVKNADYLPLELTPFNFDKAEQQYLDIINPWKLVEGSRRDNLFRRAQFLINLGWQKSQILNLIRAINNYFFKQKLDDSEVKNCLSGLVSYTAKELKKTSIFFDEDSKKFCHNIMGDHLIITLYITKYNNQFYYYLNGSYVVCSENFLKEQTQLILPALNLHQQKEVINYIFNNTRLVKKQITNNNYLGLLNGLLNLETLELEPFNKAIFTTNILPITYNPDAKCPILGKFLTEITNKNANLWKILTEYLGYCLTPNCEYQVALILLGQKASNGKSTFLKLVNTFFGNSNVANIQLEQIGQRFKATGLLNKMVNIGYEIKTDFIKNVEVFKSLIVGDSITTEFKGKDPFTFKNSAKMIFATNKLPASLDKSEGLYRRFIILPFETVFKGDNLDLNIFAKISTPYALSSLLNLALSGLKRLRTSYGFTKDPTCEYHSETFRDNNNQVRPFIKEYPKPLEQRNNGLIFHNQTVFALYDEYKTFCKNRGCGVFSEPNFIMEVKEYYQPTIKINTKEIQEYETYKKIFVVENLKN